MPFSVQLQLVLDQYQHRASNTLRRILPCSRKPNIFERSVEAMRELAETDKNDPVCMLNCLLRDFLRGKEDFNLYKILFHASKYLSKNIACPVYVAVMEEAVGVMGKKQVQNTFILLCYLQVNTLLTQNNLDWIKQGFGDNTFHASDFINLLRIVIHLHKAGLFNQSNLDILRPHIHSILGGYGNIADSLDVLVAKNQYLLTQDSFQLLLSGGNSPSLSRKPMAMVNDLITLDCMNLLTSSSRVAEPAAEAAEEDLLKYSLFNLK